MTPQVLVVGAGPTGLLLAAELRRRDVDCELIDSLDAPLHWDRATVVHPRSLEVFAALGVVDQLLDVGVRQRAVRLHSDGALLGEIDLSTCGSGFGFNLGLSEEVTESVLLGHLHRLGGSVRRASRLVGLEQRRDAVVATVEEAGARRELTAEWVVGCDGVHSPTRTLTGIDYAGHDLPTPWAVFDATLDGWAGEADVVLAYLERTPVILTPLPARRWRAYVRPSSPTSDLVAEAGQVLRSYWPAASFAEVRDAARFHCHSKVAAGYRSGRVLLAGDAAHASSPSEGHGMNSGLQDAFNLAWKLALVCDRTAEPEVLDSYEAERRPVALNIARSGDEAERLQATTDPVRRIERDAQLRAVFADPATRRQAVLAEAELDVSYAGSPIVDGDGDPRLRPGERLPGDAPVAPPAGAHCRLQDLTHCAGHTLLVLARRSQDDALLRRLVDALRDRVAGSPLLDAVRVLSTASGSATGTGRIEPRVADELGVADVTVLAVRPDGHVGLRIDDADDTRVGRYLARITGAGAPSP